MAVWSNTALSTIETQFGRFDAEFYRPEFLDTDRSLSSIDGVKLRGVASKIDVGHVGPMVRHYSEAGVLLLQTQNVREFFLDLGNSVRVTPEFHASLIKSQVHRGDILIARSGSFGSAAIYLEDSVVNSADIIIVQIDDPRVNALYAVTFMNTRYGSAQLVRFASGGVQGHVNLRILEHFRIPILDEVEQERIAEIVQEAYVARTASAESYAAAQQLLESELGLDKLTFQKPVGYTAWLSDLENSRRSDAEFYNPELHFLWAKLSKKFYLRGLPEFVKITKFANPDYGDNGFPIVTQKHLRNISPEGYGDDLRATTAWGAANLSAILRTKDLLFYSVGAYLGKTNIWLNSDEAVPASFITLLRCHESTDSGFLQVLLNSRYGLLQSKCFQSGTSQQYIYPKDIRRFLVPDVRNDLRKQIHMLVLESYAKEQESKALLEQAKVRVEQLIEEAVQP